MTLQELKALLTEHESSHPATHLTAYITFSSFGSDNRNDYEWAGRTYVISSDNKAFQPDKGGCSILGSCLDGSDPHVSLELQMQDEHGGKDGWTVEDCCIIGYLLIECSELNISDPTLFYTHSGAADAMLSQLAEKGELDAVQVKNTYSVTKELYEEDWYGAGENSAWLADSSEDWHWKILPVRIYTPLHIVFGHE